MPIAPVSSCVMTAGVRLHGRERASAEAIAARPAATMNSSTTSATPLERW